jgi:signal transduction histidine kinase
MLSSIKNNTTTLKKLHNKLLFIAKLTSATLTHTNGETIVSSTPKAATLGALRDVRPISASLRGSAVSLFELGLAAKSKMPIRQTETLTAEQTANALAKDEVSPLMIVPPRFTL